MAKVEQDFVKASSDNLPHIDMITMFTFMKNNPDFISAEMRGVKTQKSTRKSYGDNAVGQVQLKREGQICIVKGKVSPEHKVNKKPYSVTLVFDEINEEILSVTCEDCVASLGGCKHGAAFVAWVHRRSEQPSPTSIECYWKKSVLSSIGTSLKFISSKELSSKRKYNPLQDDDALNAVIDAGSKIARTATVLEGYFKSPNSSTHLHLSLHHLIKKKSNWGSYEEFVRFCNQAITKDDCISAEAATRDQSDSPLWYELRYGRITASKAYEVSRCHTVDGSLVETIMGAMKIKETAAMTRGKLLESKVRSTLNKENKMKFRCCGLMLSGADPFLGASADGIFEDVVLEIKCPSTQKTLSKYIENGIVTPKYNAQIQLQMYMYDKRKGVFCVADPDFETTSKIYTVEIDRNEGCIKELVEKCSEFWRKAIFPVLH